ncbi:DUF3667 domain-containing protein [Flavobacteriaceae bacterium M23B6Z8]
MSRITFKETVASFLSASFAIEGPFAYTLRGLVTNPGKVFREFFQGKRKTYYKPVAFFVLTSALYIIIKTLINFDPLNGQIAIESEGEKIPRMLVKTREAARFMVSHINHILIFLVFAIALITKLFFWKKYNLTEYTVVGFFIAGMYILVGIPLMFITKYTSFNSSQIQILLLFVYIMYSILSLFTKRNFTNLAAAFFVGILSIAFYIILGYGFSLAVVLLKN